MDVTNWDPRVISAILLVMGLVALPVGLLTGPIFSGMDADERCWAVVTEVDPPAHRLDPRRQARAHGLDDATRIYRFSYIGPFTTVEVGDQFILAGDPSDPSRFVLARELQLTRPIFHLAGQAFSWHGAFGIFCLLVAPVPLTRWWRPEESSPAFGAFIAGSAFLLLSGFIALSAMEDGKIAAAVDRATSLTFVVETTQEIPGDRFRGLLKGWYALGHLAGVETPGAVPISLNQYQSLVAGDELEVHKTTLDIPKFVKVETAEAHGRVFRVFDRPFTSMIFFSGFLLAFALFFIWAAWHEIRGPARLAADHPRRPDLDGRWKF